MKAILCLMQEFEWSILGTWYSLLIICINFPPTRSLSLSFSPSTVVVLYVQGIGTKEWREVSERTILLLILYSMLYCINIVLVPCFMSWKERSQKSSICTKSLFRSNNVHSFVYIPVSEHFSFAKIIHPLDRCGISRSWLNSMLISFFSHFIFI
jgi:hypothetical protein